MCETSSTTEVTIRTKHILNKTICELKIKHMLNCLTEEEKRNIKEKDCVHTSL